MGGGDLLNLLIERDVFEEDFTRFYVAEVRVSFFFFSSEVRLLIVLVLVSQHSVHCYLSISEDGPCY